MKLSTKNEIMIQVKGIKGLFGWCFWKLFLKAVFGVKKNKIVFEIEFWKTVFVLKKKTCLVELIKKFF